MIVCWFAEALIKSAKHWVLKWQIRKQQKRLGPKIRNLNLFYRPCCKYSSGPKTVLCCRTLVLDIRGLHKSSNLFQLLGMSKKIDMPCDNMFTFWHISLRFWKDLLFTSESCCSILINLAQDGGFAYFDDRYYFHNSFTVITVFSVFLTHFWIFFVDEAGIEPGTVLMMHWHLDVLSTRLHSKLLT